MSARSDAALVRMALNHVSLRDADKSRAAELARALVSRVADRPRYNQPAALAALTLEYLDREKPQTFPIVAAPWHGLPPMPDAPPIKWPTLDGSIVRDTCAMEGSETDVNGGL